MQMMISLYEILYELHVTKDPFYNAKINLLKQFLDIVPSASRQKA